MSGLAKVFSTIDSIKRVLGGYADSPLEAMARAGAANREQGVDKPLKTDAQMQAELENVAMNFMPGAIGKILFHGGPQAVTKVNNAFTGNNIEGPGFYLSNILNTPLNFATKGGKQSGVISAFDFPDELYAKLLRLNDKPTTAYPDLDKQLLQLLNDTPELQARLSTRGTPPTGNWINQQLAAIGGFDAAAETLGKAGIPGKTWQYAKDRPAEMASVVTPNYTGLLEPIAQLSVEPGIAGARAANIAMKAILGIK